MGEVVSIHIISERDGVAESVESIMAVTNYGLEGDWRSRRNRNGQLTLIEIEALEEVGKLLGYTVPPGASRRQIVVRGVDLDNLMGHRVRLGPVRLFIESPCDPCARMEKTIGSGAREALQGRGGVRCHVLAGGMIRVGDQLTDEPFAEEILERAASQEG